MGVLLWSSPHPARTFFAADFERVEAIKVGMTHDQVAQILGPPDLEYTAENVPENYYWPGYRFKRRPVSGKVLIYKRLVFVAYIYLSVEGTVEEVFTGGT